MNSICVSINWMYVIQTCRRKSWKLGYSLRESIPRLCDGGKTTMTTRCAPACSQALPVKPQGVWARGIEAWVGSRDLRNQGFRRWVSSGPSSLMIIIKNESSSRNLQSRGVYWFHSVCPSVRPFRVPCPLCIVVHTVLVGYISYNLYI